MRFEAISYTTVMGEYDKWLNSIYAPFVYDNDTKQISAADILWTLDTKTYWELLDKFCAEKHIAIMRVDDGDINCSHNMTFYKEEEDSDDD